MPSSDDQAACAGEQATFDVIIIGAGLSGIGAACHLRRQCPERSVLILEARAQMGGTWDLFRYPGIRSDSDMHTLGYNFKPWTQAEALADGPAILDYIRETARENDIESQIRYRQRVRRADWDSTAQCWTLTVEDDDSGETASYRARFLHSCSGYYRYDHGHQPEFPGREDFAGDFVHPQHWPEDLDYRDKRVVIIGSGATAMTLVPAMADTAAHVTMLQRSPTYVISRAPKDAVGNLLRAVLPERLAYRLTRAKNIAMQSWFYRRTRTAPEKIRRMLLKDVAKRLGSSGDIADFTPSYDPWDQRLCLLPDGDLFQAIRSGRAEVVTAEIDCLLADGIRLTDGTVLPADIIVSATGLELEVLGGVDFAVDGAPFEFPGSWSYRGVMLTGLPNMVSVFGYINASWTLRADIVSQWFCRLLNHMRDTGAGAVVPALRPGDEDMAPRPWIDGFSAGYMQRAMSSFPRQGDREPWVNSQDYQRERREFAEMDLDEVALVYETDVATVAHSPVGGPARVDAGAAC